ncbi:hypothetical protein NDR87_04160 [Nocardia sp. CDC159]|uniref:Uncharacterized protein n=1 Tax=Nocardia pulmonis TaxID=2951408 RepID=A0A9X2E7X5_9NOCA|nr:MULTISPECIES: hypothetical protein [Nocardia]MCM6773143.1 hypothetical protein [Nocardia pulmonis]MCM6785554.1 hypothetical protein [Nocardia sp. CDC159]
MTTEIEIEALEPRILHAIRVAGWLGSERVRSWLPEAVPDLDGTLAALVGRELLRQADTAQGRLFGATESGARQADTAIAAGALALPAIAELTELLREFERADPVLKEHVTAFQRARDAAGAGAVVEFHRAQRDLLARIGASGILWSGYPARFGAAAEAIESGDHDYVASPLIDSYHTVWHLLHRDLRATAAALRG